MQSTGHTRVRKVRPLLDIPYGTNSKTFKKKNKTKTSLVIGAIYKASPMLGCEALSKHNDGIIPAFDML